MDPIKSHMHLLAGRSPQFFAGRFHEGVKPALIQGKRTVRWRELNERVNRLANGLLGIGIKPGDHVALLSDNSIEFVESVYAIALIGAAVLPLSTRFVQSEIEYALQHCDVTAAIVQQSHVELIHRALGQTPALAAGRCVVIDGTPPPEMRSYTDLQTSSSSAKVDTEVDENSAFWIGLTGGTTGYPKAAIVTHRVMVQWWMVTALEFNVLGNDIQLVTGPLYHGLAFFFLLAQLYVGGTGVILETFDAAAAVDLIEKERVTNLAMVPTMYNSIVNVPGVVDRDLTSVTVIISGGSPLLTPTKQALLKTFPCAGIYEYYGATDGGIFCLIKPRDQFRKERSVGEPILGVEVQLLNDEKQPAAQGEVGEFWKRGLGLGAYYYKDPQGTTVTYHGELHSVGDLGRQDKEGYYYLVDRKNDMIISGGLNVYPTEIENVLQSHPEVLEVAVVGLPDPRWGEAVTAFVVSRPDVPLDSTELQAYCRGRLSPYKIPKRIDVVDSLPKSAAGKILRRSIREQYWPKGLFQIS
jgi:fatty-acyl-CoA synthase